MSLEQVKYRTKDKIVATRLSEDEMVLLNLATKQYFSLNETGILFWKLLESDNSLEAIAQAFTENYDIDMVEARERVLEFVETLSSEKLIEKV